MLHSEIYAIGDPRLKKKLESSFAIRGAEDPDQKRPIAVVKVSSSKGCGH